MNFDNRQPNTMNFDNKQPNTMNFDNKQPANNDKDYYYTSNLPGYGVSNANGITPQQKEQQQVQQQIESSHGSGYPGVVGGTPQEAKDIQGYDAQGNPIIPPFIAQRHQIEQSLGPTCKDGGYHDLRMHLTTSSLLFAILIIPYCCGYRGKRETVCKKCNQKFPQIVLPSA